MNYGLSRPIDLPHPISEESTPRSGVWRTPSTGAARESARLASLYEEDPVAGGQWLLHRQGNPDAAAVIPIESTTCAPAEVVRGRGKLCLGCTS
jgi:hypothetical protein